MSTTLDPSTASGPHRDASTGAPTRPPGRGWVLAGLGAGLAGIASVVASGMVDAVYDPATSGRRRGDHRRPPRSWCRRS